MSESSCIPLHRAGARPLARTACASQECSGWRHTWKTQVGLQGVGFPASPTECGSPRGNLENSTKNQKRFDLQIIPHHHHHHQRKPSEPDILQHMSRHCESSSLREFTSVFSFAACPSPRKCSHYRRGPGISKPSGFDQTERFLVFVSKRNVGWKGKPGKTLEPGEIGPQR